MSKRRPYKSFVTLAFALAVVARGWGVWYRGLIDHDEGHALLNANTWWHVMRWILGGGLWAGDRSGSIMQLRDALHQQGGTLYSAGKLGYSLLVGAVALPGHVSTGLALALAWLAGCVVAALAGVLAWQYCRSRLAALVAIGGCLTSPLLIELSREASGTIWALVFGLAGAAVINGSLTATRAGQRWFLGLAGGGLLGYGFACHFNLAPFILAVYLAAALYGWPRVALGEMALIRLARLLLPAALGGLGMLALFEAGTQTADYVLRNSYPEFLPFSGELRRLFFRDQAPMLKGVLYGDGAIGWGPEAWAVYGRALLREGPAWLIVMTALLSMAAWRSGFMGRQRVRSGSGAAIAPAVALLIVPALFWAAYIYRVERSLGMCMAASWILAGVIFGPILEKMFVPSRGGSGEMAGAVTWRTAIEIMIVMQLGAGGIAIGQLAVLRSPLPAAVAETFAAPAAQGKLVTAGSFDASFAPLWKWAIVEHERGAERESAAGDQMAGGVVVDFSRFHGPELIFVDPSTWDRPDPDFSVTRAQVETGQVIAVEKSAAPAWTVWSALINQSPRQWELP